MSEEPKIVGKEYSLTVMQRLALAGLLKQKHEKGDFLTVSMAQRLEKRLTPTLKEQEAVKLMVRNNNGQFGMTWDIELNEKSEVKIIFQKKEDILVTQMFEKMNADKEIPNEEAVLELFSKFVQ